MVDAEGVVERLETWWAELLGGLVALAGGVVAFLDGDYLSVAVAVVLVVYAVDRTRLRLDNRSLARVLRDVREGEETD